MPFKLLFRYIVWAIACAAILPAQVPKKEVSSPTIPKNTGANPEILRLVIADQWDRGNDMFGNGQVRALSNLDWKATAKHDAERHEAVRSLLADGKLKTKEDFSYASIIFQHSSDPADLMLAHVLSSTSYGMGGADRWMMAATMDRYLQSIKQPQIFGTQFRTNDGGQTWTMEPYNRNGVTDAERALWCVVPLEQQEKVLQQYQKGNGRGSTAIESCK
jgi:hypothetical protein